MPRKITLLEIKRRAAMKAPRAGTAAYYRWWKARKALGMNTVQLSQRSLIERNKE